ncbi:MAG: hypothetical protein HRU22_18225 [Gammaproteobacteria bacterium]|nr:hypothetical protein [Gammaproteobacteria bacterium]
MKSCLELLAENDEKSQLSPYNIDNSHYLIFGYLLADNATVNNARSLIVSGDNSKQTIVVDKQMLWLEKLDLNEQGRKQYLSEPELTHLNSVFLNIDDAVTNPEEIAGKRELSFITPYICEP